MTPVSAAFIKAFVARHYGISVTQIDSHQSTAEIVRARRVGVYVASRMTKLSMKSIGSAFGDRDHSMVVPAVRAIKRKLEEDPAFAAEVGQIETNIRDILNAGTPPEKLDFETRVDRALAEIRDLLFSPSPDQARRVLTGMETVIRKEATHELA